MLSPTLSPQRGEKRAKQRSVLVWTLCKGAGYPFCNLALFFLPTTSVPFFHLQRSSPSHHFCFLLKRCVCVCACDQKGIFPTVPSTLG